MKIKKLGLMFKAEDVEVRSFILELLDFLEKREFIVCLPQNLAHILGRDRIGVKSIEAEDLDALVVVGGDGTLLKVFHAIKRELPMILVNSGTLGFFYNINRSNYRKAFDLIARGEYEVKTWRTGLAELESGKNLNFLNEIVAYNRERGKMMIFELSRDGVVFMKGRCDGVIAATTLGSTAYSLSQGGPIVDWELETLIFTPISPFSPIIKPVVFSPESILELKIFTDSVLVIDGYISTYLKKRGRVKISLRGRRFSLVRVHSFEPGFFYKIRQRLTDEIFYSKFL